MAKVELSPYADIYTITFRRDVAPSEEMVRKVFKGCAFTGRKVEFLGSANVTRLPPPAPSENPATAGRVALGKRLFRDKRLSVDQTMACSNCHQPERAFTNGRVTATGLRGQRMPRNVPTLVNVGYRRSVFWDGRTKSLEEMTSGAIEHPAVIDMTAKELTERLRSIPEYDAAFRSEFGQPPSAAAFVLALTAYERSLVDNDTPFDRFARGDRSAISAAARRGWRIFCDKANCITCHAGPDFTDEEFRRIGIGWNGKEYTDLGRGKVDGRSQSAGMFRVPPLRELRWTAPYMHDGSLKSLPDVVDYYNRGGAEGAPTDLKGPLKLTESEKKDLVAFLESLSSETLARPASPQPGN